MSLTVALRTLLFPVDITTERKHQSVLRNTRIVPLVSHFHITKLNIHMFCSLLYNNIALTYKLSKFSREEAQTPSPVEADTSSPDSTPSAPRHSRSFSLMTRTLRRTHALTDIHMHRVTAIPCPPSYRDMCMLDSQ